MICLKNFCCKGSNILNVFDVETKSSTFVAFMGYSTNVWYFLITNFKVCGV